MFWEKNRTKQNKNNLLAFFQRLKRYFYFLGSKKNGYKKMIKIFEASKRGMSPWGNRRKILRTPFDSILNFKSQEFLPLTEAYGEARRLQAQQENV